MALKQYYASQEIIFGPAMNAPKPNYIDTDNVTEQQIQDYIDHYFIAAHHKNQIANNIVAALQTLSDAELKTVYDKLNGPKANARLTEEEFVQNIRKGFSRMILDTELFGTSVNRMLDVYEEALGPERVEQIVKAPVKPHPMSPVYTESKVYSPYEKEIQILRDKYTNTGDPAKNAKNRTLLQKVSRTLQDVRPEVLQSYHEPRAGGSVPEYEKYDDIVGRRLDVYQARGLQKLGNGRFKDLVKPGPGKGGAPHFDVLSDAQYPFPMTEDQEKALGELSKDPNTGLSPDTRQALRDLSQCLDEMHFEQCSSEPLSGQYFPLHRPASPKDSHFQNEEGDKYYAFRPVVYAKRRLVAAVKEGDLEKVRRAQDEYDRIEAILDKAFGILKSDKFSSAPLFSPNVESTRSTTGDLPEKYLLDTTNQRKLNCLYVAYATLKNAGLTLEDLFTDPVNTAKTIGKKVIAAGGMNSRQGSIGATLQNGMKGNTTAGTADHLLHHAWTSLDAAMERGMGGIVGMEKDPEKGAELLAAFHLGLRSATKEIREEIRRYEIMSEICEKNEDKYDGMRGTLFQSAAVLPEKGPGALDLGAMMDSFGKPEQLRPAWQDEMDRTLDYISGVNNFDWSELAGRNMKVLHDVAQEEQISCSYQNSFSRDQYLLHAFSIQSRLVRFAAERGENSKEFQAFRQSVKDTWKLAQHPDVRAILKMGSVLMDDPEAYDFLRTGKSDQIVKSDSDEYTDMRRSLEKIQKVKELLVGGNPVKLEKLYLTDFCSDLEKAKEDAFKYVRLKYKNGKKTTFHYESGAQRAREGLRNYRQLVKLQDALGLRSRAQKTFEDARMELLNNRRDKQWLYGPQGKAAIAKMLYAKSFVDAKIPDEDQKKAFTAKGLNNGVNRILQESLHRIQNSADLEGLADAALENSGLFKRGVDAMAARREERFNNKTAASRLEKAKEDCAKGFALDEACKALKITQLQQTYSVKNPFLQAKAEEIMKDPDFREVMRRMTEGKTIEEVEQLHTPAEMNKGSHGEEKFKHLTISLEYEKRCAAVAAEAALRSQNEGRDPSQAEIDNFAATLRKDPRFQTFIGEKQSGFRRAADYRNAINQLNQEGPRNQFLLEMSKKVTKPIQQPAAIANRIQPQIGSANPVIQNSESVLLPHV